MNRPATIEFGEQPFLLSLTCLRPGSLRVTSFRGKEEMNAGYRFEIAALFAGEEADLSKTIGSRAWLSLGPRGFLAGSRHIHGIATRVCIVSTTPENYLSLRIRIEPEAVLLKRRRQRRIFEGSSTPDLAIRLLSEWGIPHRLRLTRDHDVREYAVQYDETDWAFLTRRLAADGLFFFFDHGMEAGDVDQTGMGDTEVLVLADDATAYTPMDRPNLAGLSVHGSGALEFQCFETTTRQRGSRVMQRGHDFRRPTFELGRIAEFRVGKPNARALVAQDVSTFAAHAQDLYVEHSEAFERDPQIDADTRAEQLDRDHEVVHAITPNKTFQLGRWFALEGNHEANGKPWVVGRIEHTATSGTASSDVLYEARLRLAPRTTALRPAVPESRRKATLETAIVASSSDDVDTDEHGRVRVRFHWDAHTSGSAPMARLRVLQPWGGGGVSTQFIPRVGAEVLVGYLGGDPDHPVVLGAVRNALDDFPFRLPEGRAKSGILTRSMPNGEGGHELSFDDTAGAEAVSLRSTNALRIEAGGHAVRLTSANDEHHVGGKRVEFVKGNATSRIEGERCERVVGASEDEVGGNRRLSVAGSERISIRGDTWSDIAGSSTAIVGGTQQWLVGTGLEGGDYTIGVRGNHRTSATGALSLDVAERISIRCGSSTIEIGPDEIVVSSKSVKLHGQERATVVSGKDSPSASIVVAGSVDIVGGEVRATAGGGGKLQLDADAKLDGAFVKLNCGADPAGGADLSSQDQHGELLFRIDRSAIPVEAGAVVARFAGPDGTPIERDVPVSGEVRFEGRPGERYVLLEVRVGDQIVAAYRTDAAKDA